jgi:hypothetical protein
MPKTLQETYNLIREKHISRTDVKVFLNKRDSEDSKELLAILADNPVQYVKKLIANENVETIMSKYLRVKGVTKTDPDLQIFVTALATMIKRIQQANTKDKK